MTWRAISASPYFTGTYCVDWVDPFAADVVALVAQATASIDADGNTVEVAAASTRSCAGFRG